MVIWAFLGRFFFCPSEFCSLESYSLNIWLLGTISDDISPTCVIGGAHSRVLIILMTLESFSLKISHYNSKLLIILEAQGKIGKQKVSK